MIDPTRDACRIGTVYGEPCHVAPDGVVLIDGQHAFAGALHFCAAHGERIAADFRAGDVAAAFVPAQVERRERPADWRELVHRQALALVAGMGDDYARAIDWTESRQATASGESRDFWGDVLTLLRRRHTTLTSSRGA